MQARYTYLLLILLLFGFAPMGLAQVDADSGGRTRLQPRESFMLKGSIFDDELLEPISNANIEISGGAYTTTDAAGDFSIRARIGDQLIVTSDAFETVYYEIQDDQSVRILVKKAPGTENDEVSQKKLSSRKKEYTNVFPKYIDSAKSYLKQDAKKSIEFVTQALESTRDQRPTSAQNGIAFETLGDINDYWLQHDLAVENYKSSLRSLPKTEVEIKLARTYRNNKNHQESLQAYQQLLEKDLTNYQTVQVYEGLGDTYIAIGDLENAVDNYQRGLQVAKDHLITPKITNLNSKIGEAYAAAGSPAIANDYFESSLELAADESEVRSVKEQSKVADFYNANRDFDKEIKLRTETLNMLDSIDLSTITAADDVVEDLTPQRQNYKIANALVAQDNYQAAIPYLEKSIAQADASGDLVVQKDATRKLSEVFRDLGMAEKSASSYENYVAVVDELYRRKEQELSQAARFSRDIALKQNRITSLENERQLNESRYKLAFENQELIEKNNKVQKWIIASLVALAVLLLAMAYFLNKGIRQQKYANNLLALKSLRTQMNPHFIFNALNSVNSFIASSDERTANKYLSDFSRLMRSVLENSEEDFIPLSKEIDLLSIYTKLEHFRFKDKFDYEIILDEKLHVDDFVIPPMLLQPYIENAVWHGLRYKETKGKLEVRFDQTDSETITITITDDGIGRQKSKELKTANQKKQQSKGMGNIKKRIQILNQMYKDKVDVTVSDLQTDGSGTRVSLIVKKDQ
ncbi:histidine kinase [Gilvibacter sp.]|uniref:histidine kinase n=1 Tax=Gilvibacter sp. TaxID=2729997 RepID=UPI003F49C391